MSRSDAQIVNILTEGRGAVMPTFLGTLALEEMWAMAHYLRSFVPGGEVSRPDVGRAPAGSSPAPAPQPVATPPNASRRGPEIGAAIGPDHRRPFSTTESTRSPDSSS